MEVRLRRSGLKTHRPSRADAPAPRAEQGSSPSWLLPLAFIAFAAIAYGPALRVPFIGDDYVFLDKTRSASFLDLWSFQNIDFGWYRPWSREVHFWALQHLVGPRELGFRAASMLLWVAVLVLYGWFVQRAGGARLAVVAGLGVASLSLWGAPLTWISGTQDLWMLVFVALTLVLVGSRHPRWAWPAYLLALLSKETAATLPLILLAQARWIEGLAGRGAARRVLPFAAITLVWFALHPTLLDRFTHATPRPATGDRAIAPHVIVTQSLQSLVNADKLFLPRDRSAERRLATVTSALVLALAAYLSLRRAPSGKRSTQGPRRGDLIRFGAVWCAAGWIPLFHPSIGWHAYYGSLAALGAWIALAALIVDRPRFVIGLLLALGILRGAAAATPSWDWGSEWYQTRAGNMLQLIRGQLLESYPTLPPNSRIYFGSIPNNIGLIAGRSPAVRVWYGDASLEAGFYSYYRPRSSTDARGPDLFFHFDSTTGIREVFADSAAAVRTAAVAPGWEQDHESVAMTLLSSGDLPRAARLFEAIATLPHRPDAQMLAAVCWQEYGDTTRAAADLERVRVRTGGTMAQMTDWAARLHASMPRRSRDLGDSLPGSRQRD